MQGERNDQCDEVNMIIGEHGIKQYGVTLTNAIIDIHQLNHLWSGWTWFATSQSTTVGLNLKWQPPELEMFQKHGIGAHLSQ